MTSRSNAVGLLDAVPTEHVLGFSSKLRRLGADQVRHGASTPTCAPSPSVERALAHARRHVQVRMPSKWTSPTRWPAFMTRDRPDPDGQHQDSVVSRRRPRRSRAWRCRARYDAVPAFCARVAGIGMPAPRLAIAMVEDSTPDRRPVESPPRQRRRRLLLTGSETRPRRRTPTTPNNGHDRLPSWTCCTKRRSARVNIVVP